MSRGPRKDQRAAREHWWAGLRGLLTAWGWVGLWVWVEAAWPALPPWARFVGMAATLGVTECLLYVRIARLEEESLTDPLTGLANRRQFDWELERALSLAQRHDHPFSLVLIDLDGFKAVNDTHGHPAGDRLLQQVGHILTSEVRKGDTAARLGGDEFALLLPHASGRDVPCLISPLRDRVRDRCAIALSFGAATYPQDGRNRDDLMSEADRRLYMQKSSRPDRPPNA